MDVERIIDDIEQLQEMFEAPDIRPLSASDISAANRRHDEMNAHSRGSGCGRPTASVVGLRLRCFNCRKAKLLGGVRVLNCSNLMPEQTNTQ
jgi:hypothetical protein